MAPEENDWRHCRRFWLHCTNRIWIALPVFRRKTGGLPPRRIWPRHHCRSYSLLLPQELCCLLFHFHLHSATFTVRCDSPFRRLCQYRVEYDLVPFGSLINLDQL